MVERDTSCIRWLLLLPCPPTEISLNSLRVAYGPSLTTALVNTSQVAASGSNVIFDIALGYNDNDVPYEYYKLQNLLGLMYRMICIICTEQHIDLEYGNDVDARLHMFHMVKTKHTGEGSSKSNRPMHSCLPDLQTLAGVDRSWQCICSLESEDGENLLQAFLGARPQSSQEQQEVQRLPGGLVMRRDLPEDDTAQDQIFHRYHSVAVGGTFDHLHAGHKLLLTMTTLVLNPDSTKESCLTIGITGDELLRNKKYREELEDFPMRLSSIRHFLLGILELISAEHFLESTIDVQKSQSSGREVHDVLRSRLIIKYVEIFDPCGPTVTDESISALVLSGETRGGGQAVNSQRTEKGWSALEIFEVDVLDTGEDGGTSIVIVFHVEDALSLLQCQFFEPNRIQIPVK